MRKRKETFDRIIGLIKEFVKNPSAKKAIETVHSGSCIIYEVPGYEEQLCRDCAWEPICQVYNITPDEITEEEVSAMVLAAMKLLAICEAENA